MPSGTLPVRMDGNKTIAITGEIVLTGGSIPANATVNVTPAGGSATRIQQGTTLTLNDSATIAVTVGAYTVTLNYTNTTEPVVT